MRGLHALTFSPASVTFGAERFLPSRACSPWCATRSARGAHTKRVTYDPGLCVPLDVRIDYLSRAADEEPGMQGREAVEALPETAPCARTARL